MKFRSLLVFLILQTQASIADHSCASSEINVSTWARFTPVDYQDALEYWRGEEPESPGLLQLFWGYRLYNQEKPNVEKIRNDKDRHCYLGCRLAEEVSYDLAVYVAWYKEDRDLRDCNPGTKFEQADFDYTIEGANAAAEASASIDCWQLCGL